MRLRFTVPALADLESVLNYIAVQSPQGASRIRARIQAVIDLLLKYPLLGVATDDPTIRRITTTPFPYLVFYEVAGEDIVIHAVPARCAQSVMRAFRHAAR
ncbi:MAG: type II toxin-antitoxin system RelE/ParE family toxin [Alphaproteobacteria bacterium]|nr:type II toxin-antitoxin system RelE/ParE family toxin [Alphaproteobacteria bacterium]